MFKYLQELKVKCILKLCLIIFVLILEGFKFYNKTKKKQKEKLIKF